MAMKSIRSLPVWQESKVAPRSSDLSEYYCPDRCGHNAVCIREELLIWGGYNEKTTIGSTYCENEDIWSYNLDLDSWIRVKTKGKIPQYRSGSCSALLWPYWYIFCGHTHFGDVSDIFRLDLVNLDWDAEQVRGVNISPRDKAASWVYENKIYCFGGYGTSPYDFLWDRNEDIFSLEVMNDRGWNDQVVYYNTDEHTWVRVSCQGPKPKGRAAHSAVCFDGVVYIFGGRHQGERLNDLHCLQLASHTWSGKISCKGVSPLGRSWHTMSRINKSDLVLFGGFNNNNLPLDDVWLLSLESFSWVELRKTTGLPRLWHTACINVQGDVLVFGGCVNNILDSNVIMETSDKVVLLRTQPFSLERLCLHTLVRYRASTDHQWDNLPKPFQEWLQQKCAQDEARPPAFKHNVETGLGPKATQLSIMTEAEATSRNGGRRYLDDLLLAWI